MSDQVGSDYDGDDEEELRHDDDVIVADTGPHRAEAAESDSVTELRLKLALENRGCCKNKRGKLNSRELKCEIMMRLTRLRSILTSKMSNLCCLKCVILMF